MNMDFIYDNYVWFIVVGVILVMALIGYIAEKTDFGRKQFEKKVKKDSKTKVKEKKKEKEEVVPVGEETISETPAEETKIDEAVVIDDQDWMQPFKNDESDKETDTNKDIKNNEDVSAEINDENLFAPLQDVIDEQQESKQNEEKEEENENVPFPDEDLTVPFGDKDVTPVINEDVTDETEQIGEVEDIVGDEKSKNIDEEISKEKKETLKKDEEENDVWKF